MSKLIRNCSNCKHSDFVSRVCRVKDGWLSSRELTFKEKSGYVCYRAEQPFAVVEDDVCPLHRHNGEKEIKRKFFPRTFRRQEASAAKKTLDKLAKEVDTRGILRLSFRRAYAGLLEMYKYMPKTEESRKVRTVLLETLQELHFNAYHGCLADIVKDLGIQHPEDE